MVPPGSWGPHGTSRSGFSTRLKAPPARPINPTHPFPDGLLSAISFPCCCMPYLGKNGCAGERHSGGVPREQREPRIGVLISDEHRGCALAILGYRGQRLQILSWGMSDAFQQELAFLAIESSPPFVRASEGNGCAERLIPAHSKRTCSGCPEPAFTRGTVRVTLNPAAHEPRGRYTDPIATAHCSP